MLRVVFYSSFRAGPFRPDVLAAVLAGGVAFDLVTFVVVLAPALLLLATLRLRPLRHRRLRWVLLALYGSALCFGAAAEYYFFEEFNARFNHIALDYLVHRTEVFANIRDSYDVPLVALLSALGGLLLSLPLLRLTPRDAAFGHLPLAARLRAGVLTLGASGLALLGLGALPAALIGDRIVSEIAHNGLVQLVRAFNTASLEYELYYPTLPTAEARLAAARFLDMPAPGLAELEAQAAGFALERTIEPVERPPARPWDAVVILEESLGSEFVGSLGHATRPACPNLDRWMAEGLALTNLTSTGNRTVRGLEGVLCSFVPLPGDSVVKRSRSEDVADLARVFRAQGFATEFYYGGYGMFDSMKPFMLTNGYDRFVEQPDLPADALRTIWGVADETIFDALLARQLEAQAASTPFFGTLLTVSNHKPYDIPEGRLDPPPDKRGRVGAVRYADWALGRYLDQARDAGLLQHTVVLVVGDHGARVYGSEQIPTPSYRIPGLFLSPNPRWHGRRIERLCSQIDLAPTLLSLAGVRCSVPFLGQDLLRQSDDGGRAFVQHNRDIGLLTDNSLVVFGLQGERARYKRSGRESDDLQPLAPQEVTPELLRQEHDAIAVYQTAWELYQNRRFRLPADLIAPAQGSR